MNKSLSIFVIASLLSVYQPAAALTNQQVFLWTKFLSLIPTGMIYYYQCPGANVEWPFTLDLHKDCGIVKPNYGKPLGWAVVTFIVTNKFFNWILSGYTPRGRYEWAQERLADLKREYLFTQEISQDNIAQVLQESGCEAHELSLVAAFLILRSFDQQLTYMINQLNRALHDEGHSDLSKKIEDLEIDIIGYLKNIRANETIVKAQPQWMKQWEVYDHRLLEQEKMIQQAQPKEHIVSFAN